jgi:hypothetical protein
MSLDDSEDWGVAGQGWDEDDLLDWSSTGMKVGRAAPAPAPSLGTLLHQRVDRKMISLDLEALTQNRQSLLRCGRWVVEESFPCLQRSLQNLPCKSYPLTTFSDGWDDF